MNAALEFTHLTKRYPGAASAAVDALDLRVESGDILALAGESGSGKTTLLRLACGLERPDSGSIRIAGNIVAGNGVWTPPEKRGIGLVFQNGALFPHLRVEDNIRYGLRHIPRDQQRVRVDTLLILVGLDGCQRRYPHELSGGERQRIAVCRALAPEPAVVLLDEPFSNLDPALRQGLRRDIHRILKELNTTAILVTHDSEDALHAGDRVAVLRAGKIEQTGTPREVYHHPLNGYCARLFGAANRVGAHWVRPEQMELLPVFAPDSHPVVIGEIRDAGRHQEILVHPQQVEPPETWVIYDAHQPILKPGMTGWVRLRP
jgi:iron(III) transport system ATP-binding protein